MLIVHFLVASKVARYMAFRSAVSLGNIFLCFLKKSMLEPPLKIMYNLIKTERSIPK